MMLKAVYYQQPFVTYSKGLQIMINKLYQPRAAAITYSSITPLFISFMTQIFLALGLVLAGLSQAQADQTVSYTYNTQGLIATINGSRTDVSDITRFAYDAQGNRIRITNALGHITEITDHDPSGRPLTIIHPNGAITELRYDPRGRLISQEKEGQVTRLDYDATGNIQKITLPTGQILTYDYDNAHRSTGYSDALGNSVTYTLDAAGNRLTETIKDPAQNLTRSHHFAYNKLSQLINDTGAGGQIASYQYDGNSNLITQTDPNDNLSQSGFDALNRLIETTDANDGLTQYQYDDRNNLTLVTDPNGHSTQYHYDIFDNLIEQNSPDTRTTIFTYDTAGNRLSQTDAKGITTSYRYDALNRLTSIIYPNNELNISYIFDENSHDQNGIGRLTTMTDASGTTQYSYDKRGNLTTLTSSRGEITHSISYTSIIQTIN